MGQRSQIGQTGSYSGRYNFKSALQTHLQGENRATIMNVVNKRIHAPLHFQIE